MVLIIQHVEGEGPGLIGEALGKFDLCQVWRGDRVPESPTHAALVVLGGPMAAWDDALQAEARLLAASARAGLPTLGICLGAQLLARGLGGRNFRGPSLEKGAFPISLSDEGRGDPLLASLDGAEVVQWHEDSFDLPPGAVLLASSAAYVNQAFRVGANAYGLQFHIECDQAMRRDWGIAPGEDAPRFAQAFRELVFSSAQR